MGWNYRVMRYREGDPKFAPYIYGVHEVYYLDDGSVWTWTEEAITPLGFDQDDLQWRLQEMLKAFQRPVLDYHAEPPAAPPSGRSSP